MKDNPLIVSLLIGLVVILVVAGVSLLVKMNTLSGVYKKELAKNISLEKTIEDLKKGNNDLTENMDKINVQITNIQKEHIQELEDAKKTYIQDMESLKEQNLRLEKLKEKLEENLKEELMKTKSGDN